MAAAAAILGGSCEVPGTDNKGPCSAGKVNGMPAEGSVPRKLEVLASISGPAIMDAGSRGAGECAGPEGGTTDAEGAEGGACGKATLEPPAKEHGAEAADA
jgi:hypothetical protein